MGSNPIGGFTLCHATHPHKVCERSPTKCTTKAQAKHCVPVVGRLDIFARRKDGGEVLAGRIGSWRNAGSRFGVPTPGILHARTASTPDLQEFCSGSRTVCAAGCETPGNAIWFFQYKASRDGAAICQRETLANNARALDCVLFTACNAMGFSHVTFGLLSSHRAGERPSEVRLVPCFHANTNASNEPVRYGSDVHSLRTVPTHVRVPQYGARCYDHSCDGDLVDKRRRAHGVVVSHPLRMRKALGSNPSVSIFANTCN